MELDNPKKVERVELLLSNILRAGLAISMFVVAIGGIIFLWSHGSDSLDPNLIKGIPNQLRTIPTILNNIWHDHGQGIMQFGIVLLIATPIARVASCLIVFAKEHNRLYVFISAYVLLALLYSLFWRTD